MTLPLITVSQMRCYRTCPRKHHLKYNELLESASGHAAYFGTLGHVGAEHWYRAAKDGSDRLDWALSAMRAEWEEADDPDEYLWQRLRAVIVGYHCRWIDEPIQVLEVESEFRAPLVNPGTGSRSRTYDLGGKIDVIVRDLSDGRVRLMEHKFTSLDISPGSDYWSRLRMDDQVSTYFEGARALGHDIAGCIYDVAKRPGQKPKQATPEEERGYTQPKSCKECRAKALAQARAEGRPKPLVKEIPVTPDCPDCQPPRLYANQREADETPAEYGQRIYDAITDSPGEYYQRGVVVRLESELEDARWDAWATGRQIRESQLQNRHVRNPAACMNYNTRCSFFGICTGEVSADSHLFTRRESAHPELSDTHQNPKEEDQNGTSEDDFE